MPDDERALEGGRQTEGIVRVGDTVRRPLHPNSRFVQALLRHLESVGFDGAPRFLGLDDRGREVLTYIEGNVVGTEEGSEMLTDAKLDSAGRLIRAFHDATAGTVLAAGAEVVCHSDLGQHNIVFQGEEAVGIIDWDEETAPGPRVLDFAHAVWSLAEIGEHGGELTEQARRARLVCDAYGWDDRDAVIDEIEARFRRALAWHEERGLSEGVRIFSAMVDWIVAYGLILKRHLA